jgi:hypothetical protein
MVSRFAKPQIGQTSSDSKIGAFTRGLQGEISVDYVALKFFGVKLRRFFVSRAAPSKSANPYFRHITDLA